METIHIRTVDPISQDLLRFAADMKVKLTWDRYEKLQPQDGFLRLGLSCPLGCLQGPCRIDPFGRGPDRGLCGLDRDGMVAALLLRLSLFGALEALNDISTPHTVSEVSWTPPLDEMVAQALKNLEGDNLSIGEIYRAAFILQRPQEPPERMILQALRLGILTLGLLGLREDSSDAPASPLCRAGYGLLAGDKITIGICGNPSSQIIEALLQESSRKSSIRVQLVSLGEWIRTNDGFLPFICTSGEAELSLISGKINLIVAGSGADPSISELCRHIEVPIVADHEARETGKILRLARQSNNIPKPKIFDPDPSLVQEARVIMTAQDLEDSLKKKGASARLALLGGADTPQLSFGWIPVELASALRGEGCLVAAWGDAALWMLKNGLISEGDKQPVRILDPHQGPLLALKAMAVLGRLKDLQGICFTGLKACTDLSVALGLASLGMKVYVAVPLPVWGSGRVRDFLADRLAGGGGLLTNLDHPVHAQEVLDWFTKP
ncbi:MAG: hypothetical protein GTO13_16115 [Proteobacteria bacterium]|nr:hypothetical protein [Pseudomonadota bacterium]